MTVHTGVDPRLLQQAAADVAQLTQPIHVPVRQDGRWRLITHDPLLHQLAAAAEPGNSPRRGPERHPKPGSRPAANLDAVAVYADLVDELATWLTTAATRQAHGSADLVARLNRLGHGAAHDRGSLRWCHEALHALIGALPDLAPSLAEGLVQAIHEWWRLAAVHTGWRPADLERLWRR